MHGNQASADRIRGSEQLVRSQEHPARAIGKCSRILGIPVSLAENCSCIFGIPAIHGGEKSRTATAFEWKGAETASSAGA
jgi:hypothetical protein